MAIGDYTDIGSLTINDTDYLDKDMEHFIVNGEYNSEDYIAHLQQLDALAKKLVGPRFNDLVAFLQSILDGKSGADQIGATPLVTGGGATVQAILDALVPKRASFRLAAATTIIASGGATVIPVDTTDYNDTGFSLDVNKRLIIPDNHGYKWASIWASAKMEGRAATQVLSIGGNVFELGFAGMDQVYGSTGSNSGLLLSGRYRLKPTGGYMQAAVEQYSGTGCYLYASSGWCVEFSKY
jgi:hypothetical protein